MARSVPARPRLSVDDWVNGGLEVLAADGLAAVKVERLATRLGVTKGSFYWHFNDLSAFLDAMATQWAASRDALCAAFPLVAPADPTERLRYLMEELSDPRNWALERAVRAWAYSNEVVRVRLAQLDDWAFQQVRLTFEELGFSEHDAEIRAKTLYYAGIGYIHTGSLGEPERRDHREGLLALLTRQA